MLLGTYGRLTMKKYFVRSSVVYCGLRALPVLGTGARPVQFFPSAGEAVFLHSLKEKPDANSIFVRESTTTLLEW